MKRKSILRHLNIMLFVVAVGMMSCSSDDGAGTDPGSGNNNGSGTSSGSGTGSGSGNGGGSGNGNGSGGGSGSTAGENFEATGAPANFTTKVLLEDYTGTWCGACPGAGVAMKSAMDGNSNIFGVGIHAGGNGDPMAFAETEAMANFYNVNAFPTVFANGIDTNWNYPNMSQINTLLSSTSKLGLAVKSTINNGKIDLEVKVGYKEAINEEVKLMVYLIEDGLKYPNSPQAGVSDGGNYEHNHVLRAIYTDKYGDVISSNNIGAGGVYTRTFTGLDIPSSVQDNSKLHIVAFVRNTYTKTVTWYGDTYTNSPHYDIYNAQEVKVGEEKAFD